MGIVKSLNVYIFVQHWRRTAAQALWQCPGQGSLPWRLSLSWRQRKQTHQGDATGDDSSSQILSLVGCRKFLVFTSFTRFFKINNFNFCKWSFGVFMWELMTKAQQPFSEVDPFEMEDYLNGGYRLHQPMNCPDQLYSVLVSCWGSQPQERASVQQLQQTLLELQKQLQQFV